MMWNWFSENSGVLISALIGAFATIFVVVLTIKTENKRRQKDLIYQAKPIVINVSVLDVSSEKNNPLQRINLYSTDDGIQHTVSGIFKNTDNGILFLDYIKNKEKKYFPQMSSVVDKNTMFEIVINLAGKEDILNWSLFLHDIYGNVYKYNAIVNSNHWNSLELENNEPILVKKSKIRR